MKNWCFWTVVLEKTLEIPLDCKKSIIKEISPGSSLEGLMLKLKLQYFATSCEELTHWTRPWGWEGVGAGGEGDDRRWDGWMALPTQWACVWMNSGSLWWTGRLGLLQFMGLQRVGHDWATELNWMISSVEHLFLCLLAISMSWTNVYLRWLHFSSDLLSYQLNEISLRIPASLSVPPFLTLDRDKE